MAIEQVVVHSRPLHSLRLPDESDEAFRRRAERSARIGKLLVEACLANECVQHYAADPELPLFTLDDVRRDPLVRIEFEQATAIGGIGETLHITRNKSWGAGPQVLPLEVDDWFYSERITYRYRENSLYNRRFEQRRRLKEMLGRQHRPLVETAKLHTKKIFLEYLTGRQAVAIRRIFNVEPGEFWRASKGKIFLDLPKRAEQLEFCFEDSVRDQGR